MDRLRAWWEGYDLPRDGPVLVGDGAKSARPSGADAMRMAQGENARDPAVDLKGWPDGRRKIAELVWGPGFTGPGGEDYFLELIRPFKLDSSLNVLEIGAGLGGGTRAMAERFGTYVTGLESDPDLAAAAFDLSKKQGVETKASIVTLDNGLKTLRDKYFTYAIMRDALAVVADRAAFISRIAGSLKSGAQIIFADVYRGDAADGEADLADIISSEHWPEAPWTLKSVEACFAKQNLVVRTADDQSAQHRKLVLRGWLDFVNRAEDESIPASLHNYTLGEAERWARRLEALDSGLLRYCHVVALKK